MGVVLLGYRGTGKTSVGEKLADKLWADFFDADRVLIEESNMSIRDMFARFGEAFFRDAESAVLTKLLARENAVVSLGDGAVLREANRTALKQSQHARIYLRCDAEELHLRIQADPATAETRPPLTTLGGGVEEIKLLLASREALYREVMTAELDVTNLSIDEAVQRIGKLI